MLKVLVDMVHEMGTFALAEGIESRSEADCCRDLGFNFVQGFFYGKPAPAEDFKNALSNPQRLQMMDNALLTQPFVLD